MRARLVVLGENDHLFILTAHHIVADGWSCGVLLRDLGKLYEAAEKGERAKLPAPMQLSEWVRSRSMSSRARSGWPPSLTGWISTRNPCRCSIYRRTVRVLQ